MTRRADINLAVENVVKHHICAVRTRRDGSITAVKHIAYGWMPIKDYYWLQKIHDLMPIIGKIIEGGYRFKAAIWSISIPIDVLASGTSVPFGVALITMALGMYAYDLKIANNPALAAFDLLCLALPFGELWILYRCLKFFNWVNNQNIETPQQRSVLENDPNVVGPLGQDLQNFAKWWNNSLQGL